MHRWQVLLQWLNSNRYTIKTLISAGNMESSDFYKHSTDLYFQYEKIE